MDAFIKMAVVQTIVDTLELLVAMRTEANLEHHKRIDEMIQRLSTMVQSL